jgi:hypothetical protein
MISYGQHRQRVQRESWLRTCSQSYNEPRITAGFVVMAVELGRSVGIVRLQTKGHGVSFFV